jgi:gluconolactonase
MKSQPMKSKTVHGRVAWLVLLSGPWLSAAAQQTAAIDGVVAAGIPIELVKDGFEAVEGPTPQSDGGLLFTNNRAGRVMRIAADGSVSTWYEGPGGANALTPTIKGEIAATLVDGKTISVLKPGEAPREIVGNYEGTPFNRPNDLVADRRGNIYFTDTPSPTATTAPAMPAAVYQLTAKGKLVRITTDITRPNGVALSPDERTLYVADTTGEWIHAIKLSRKGEAKERREFAKLETPPPQNGAKPSSGSDGLAVDEKGRVYAATTLGVQVVSAEGKPLGIIAMPKQPQNLAFSGPGRSVLFVVGRGSVYRIATLTHGPDRPGK